LRLVAPGQPLREGLDRILQAKRGCLIVIGDSPSVLSLCTGGFLLDAEFTPQRLSELAKMDGAIILAPDGSRIARANVHLTPRASVPTQETGTRHRTAERVARSLDVPVVTVSAAMSTIAVFAGATKSTVVPTARLVDRANQALATLQRFRTRFDSAASLLSTVEIEDAVSLGDVVAVLQPAEILRRIADEVADDLVELGAEGRLIELQLDELVEGVSETAQLIIADYASPRSGGGRAAAAAVLDRLDQLGTDELHDSATVAAALGISAGGDLQLSPRGFRMLAKVPKVPAAVVDRLVGRFGSLAALLSASISDLEEVEGVGEARARVVRAGLSRLVEASVLQRFD